VDFGTEKLKFQLIAMRLRIYDPRILALDLRMRRFGYAVFEGPRRLLDSGATSQVPSGRDPAPVSQWRIGELLKLWTPEAIVVKREVWESLTGKPPVEYFARILTQEAIARSTEIRLLGRDQLAWSFRNLGCQTKYEVASVLVQAFPELAWKLPTERKPWESEDPRMSIFDAAAIGYASWQHQTVSAPHSRLRSMEDEIA
jgi:hypothetical protein